MERDRGTALPKCQASLRVADEVIARAVGFSALQEPGVESLTSTLVGGIGEHLARKTAYRGVRLTIEDGRAEIELYVVVTFGYKIPELAQRIQSRVKSEVERMIGLTVDTVNVHIQGITMGGGTSSR